MPGELLRSQKPRHNATATERDPNVLGSGAGTENRAYADAIDTALTDSAQTRWTYGTLITHVNELSIPYEEATAKIAGIIEQRRSLLTAVSAEAAPPAFSQSAALLRRSLVASIDDDLAVANWIDAIYSDDSAAAGYHWQRQSVER